MTTNKKQHVDRRPKHPNFPFGSRNRSLVLPITAILFIAGIAIYALSFKSPKSTTLQNVSNSTNTSEANLFAGINLLQFDIPGLLMTNRVDRAYDDGGLSFTFENSLNEKSVHVQIAVAPDAKGARTALDMMLRGIPQSLRTITDSTLGEAVFVDDDNGKLIAIAAVANIAYSVNVYHKKTDIPMASEIVAQLRALLIPGIPKFPRVTIKLPSVVDVDAGANFQVKTDSEEGGGYFRILTSGAEINNVRGLFDGEGEYADEYNVLPYKPGPFSVFAIISDNLGRVSMTEATSTAKLYNLPPPVGNVLKIRTIHSHSDPEYVGGMEIKLSSRTPFPMCRAQTVTVCLDETEIPQNFGGDNNYSCQPTTITLILTPAQRAKLKGGGRVYARYGSPGSCRRYNIGTSSWNFGRLNLGMLDK